MGTKIPYCDEVCEVTGGCTKCSDGCKRCWAIQSVWRLAHSTNPKVAEKWSGLVEKTSSGLNWTGKIKCFEDALKIPLRRKKATTYFIDSKADLFHEKVPFEFIGETYGMIAGCSEHTFQVLTKRVDRALEFYKWLEETQWPKMWPPVGKPDYSMDANVVVQFVKGEHFDGDCPACKRPLCRFAGDYDAPEWPLKNLHLGVSVENQKTADKRIPILLQIPAAVRFVSIEPMLGAIKLNHIKTHKRTLNALIGKSKYFVDGNTPYYGHSLDQVIIGCESINGRLGRLGDFKTEREWRAAAIDIVEQCRAAGVSVFVKQIPLNGKLCKDINKFPPKLQFRESVKCHR